MFMENKRALIDERLLKAARFPSSVPEELQEAMRYSLFSGGKRLRPVLTLATAEALGASLEPVIPFACAIEMIHTYSLIHDDLPAMDDDDTRRGRPTNHKVYGEAMAILAGDALLTKAFGMMTQCMHKPGADPAQLVELIKEAALAAGAEGMVGGQAADILAERKTLSLQALIDMHRHKTGAMLRLSVRAGAILSGADSRQLEALTRYADNIGLAFQIQDDILDVIGDARMTGKPVGSDQAKEKSTFPALLGIDASRRRVLELIGEAKQEIAGVEGIEGRRLHEIADYLVSRDH